MGLSSADFYALTLRQFMALQDRLVDSERRADRRTARLCAQIVNMAGRHSSKLFTEDDFMPGGKPEHQQTWQEQHAILMNWKANFRGMKAQGGKVRSIRG